ncbi:MAG: acylneuraminate cytidylyltransferase family protein [Tyzzerella sp.]|nr:acylneuraminate cytidylyltransferase family protein [Tyzzerella sp.]
MNLLFTICGRAGSKGIKNKNIRNFLGKLLPYYTLSAIDLYKHDNTTDEIDVVVNSDSKELLSLMKENPFFEIHTIDRATILGGDDVPKIQVIQNCLEKMESMLNKKYDMVVDLDITSPLRTKEDLINLVNTQKEKKADVTFSVTDSRRNPYFNMVKRVDKGVKKVLDSDFTTRQQAPEIFDMNASMYAYKPEYLLSGKNVLDGYCECIHMYDTGILDLDHENDFELMEVIARYLFEKKHEFRSIYEHIQGEN